MNNRFRYTNLLYFVLAAFWLLPSCSADEEFFSVVGGKETVVTFRPTVANSLPTRAISDGKSVDKLMVKVYDNEGNHLLGLDDMSLSEAQEKGVSLTLIDGRDYKVLFFAYDESNTAYTLSDNGTLSVDYEKYLDRGFAGMEELDVFYTVHSLKALEGAMPTITLTRPTAQLNFVDATTQPIKGTHKAVVTLNNIPTSLNFLTGETSGTASPTFTFADYNDETLSVNDNDAWYVTTNYIFVPTSESISASIELQTTEGESLNKKEVTGIKVEVNKRTNVLGEIVMMPETVSTWDGITLSQPEVDDQNRYIIDEASDLAWLQENGHTLDPNSTFLVTTDIDMAKHEIKSLLIQPGSTITNEDDKVHTIKNLNILTGGLFGEATNLSVSNLNIEDITANSTTTHVGALVNTLKGSGTFSGVTIKNANVSTTNGAAGGIIGYIVREDKDNRDEILNVNISNCHINNSTIDGTLSEGHFVGLLRGYDNNETLTFEADCSVGDNNTIDYASMYKDGNEGEWLAANDYSNFNGWLGNEECYRAIVKYGENRFVPKWDGTIKITPLTENSTTVIYSAFDLADLQGKNFTNVVFKENVDLGGNREAKTNSFTPIGSIKYLDGGNYTLYNLYVEVDDMGGFISQAVGESTHENLTFENSSVVVHFVTLNGEDRGYAGTLTPAVWSGTNYVVSNIKVNNGYVFGLGKIGGLIGFIDSGTTGSTVKDCTVTGTTVKNEKGKTQELFEKSAAGATVSMKFYAHGEAGGLIGMLMGNSAISNCHVTNSTMDCYGEADQSQQVTVLFFPVKVTVQGRHVNNFIGDIRTAGYWIGDEQYPNIVTIDNCSATNNTYITTDGKRKDEPFDFSFRSGWSTTTNTTNLVGTVYYLNVVKIVQVDPKGSVKIDGKDFM